MLLMKMILKYGGLSTRKFMKFTLRELKCLLMSSLNFVKEPNVPQKILNYIKRRLKQLLLKTVCIKGCDNPEHGLIRIGTESFKGKIKLPL